MGWTITVNKAGGDPAAITDTALEELTDELAGFGGIASGTPQDSTVGRYSVTLSIGDTDNPVSAVDHAVNIVAKAAANAGLPVIPVTRVEIMTWEEHDAWLADAPQLAGVGEIAELLGISRQRASTLQTREGFPAPRCRLASGPVWELRDVAEFQRTWQRTPGRPRKRADA